MRISAKFQVPRGNCLYSYRGSIYTEQPLGTVVKYYEYDKDKDVYIAELRGRVYLVEAILLFMLIISIYQIINHKVVEVEFNLPDEFVIHDNVMDINVVNLNDVDIRLTILNASDLLYDGVIYANGSLSSVRLNEVPLDQYCEVVYSIGKISNTSKVKIKKR